MMKEHEVLTRIEGLTRERLRICVTEAWVKPAASDDGHLFDDIDVARMQLIVELVKDLQVNDDAVPIILSLIDQVHALRQRLGALDRAIAAQDAGIRAEIAAQLAAKLNLPPRKE